MKNRFFTIGELELLRFSSFRLNKLFFWIWYKSVILGFLCLVIQPKTLDLPKGFLLQSLREFHYINRRQFLKPHENNYPGKNWIKFKHESANQRYKCESKRSIKMLLTYYLYFAKLSCIFYSLTSFMKNIYDYGVTNHANLAS